MPDQADLGTLLLAFLIGLGAGLGWILGTNVMAALIGLFRTGLTRGGR